MQKTNRKIVAILLLSSLLLTSSVFIQSAYAQNVAWIEPPVIYTNVCQEFTITVVADVLTPITMFEFWLNFDPTQMQVTNVVASPPWTLSQFSIGSDYVWVLGIYEPSVGPGTVPLADITFHCIASGTSDLSFDYIMVVDPGGYSYELTWKGATVNQYDFYWKPLGLTDYALSGVPDFDQKQDAWTNPKTGKWSFCGPTAIANSFWWLDSFYEPSPVAPPSISDHFPLVWSYNSQWDDHDPRNVGPLINDLSWYMDTDGKRTGSAHNGTNVMDMARGIDQYLLDHGLYDDFYQKTVKAPDFHYIETEVEKCEDVTLLLGFWQQQPIAEPPGYKWVRVGGHYVTVAGVDSEGLQIAFSDPCVNNAEAGGPGVVLPGPHGASHPSWVHNDTRFVSHDIYAAWVPGHGGSPGNPMFEVGYNEYEVVNWTTLISNTMGQNSPDEFASQSGPYVPGLTVFTEVEYAVIVSPWNAKPPQPDYAPSGVPDFDQRQNGIMYEWTNPYPPVGTWSFCGPTAMANSLWWLDSEFEPNPIPPPVINDGFPLVESYNPDVWDDHDPQNVPYLIENLAYLMNTDNLQGIPGQEHCGTSPTDMQRGIEYYLEQKELSWKFYEHTEKAPNFFWIEEEVKRCEDVILLLGFWQWQEIEPGYWAWQRMGGHYVTVVGVDSTDMYLAISDPFRDAAEYGGIIPGSVLPLGHDAGDHTGPPETLHNNASYVSHDIYTVGPSKSPGGPCGLVDYYADEEGFIDNFDSCQNFPDEFWEYEGHYNPIYGPVYTEIEYAIVVSCKTGVVAAGSEDGNVYVHDFYGNLTWKWFEEAYCVSVALDNEAKYLAAGWRLGQYGLLGFFDVNAATGGVLNPPLWTKSLAISESYDGGWMGKESKSVDVKYNFYNQYYIVAAAHDYGLNLYDQWGNLIWQYFDEEGPETIVRISQDGNYIVCADYNSMIVHCFSHLRDGVPGWGPEDGTPIWSFGGYMDEFAVYWTAISGIGDYVAVSGWFEPYPPSDPSNNAGVLLLNATGDVVWWYNLPKGGFVRVDMPCNGRSIVAVNDNPNDQHLGCDLNYWSDMSDGIPGWSSTDNIPIWSYWPGKEFGYEQNPVDDLYTVAISENGDYVATGGIPHNTYLLKNDGTLEWTFGLMPGAVQSVDLTFSGKYGASVDNAGALWFFDKDTGLKWQWPNPSEAPFRCVAVSKIYPCMFPFPNHDLAVTDVTLDKALVAPGGIVGVNVTVTNEGDFIESFFDVFVEILYDGTPQPGVSPLRATVPSLGYGNSKTITFTWDTTGLPEGAYTVIAKTSIVHDEIDVYDNTLINGIINVVAGVHDVAVTDVETFITVCTHTYHPFDLIFENFTVSINATIENHGDFSETFDIILEYDTTIIQTIHDFYLDAHTSANVTFTWDTHGVTKGSYTIAVVAVLPTDDDPGDNTKTRGPVKVTWLGDMDGDFDVDEDDLWYFCEAFIDYYKIHVKDPLCDIDRDCDIDEDDLWTFCEAFIAYWKAQ